MSASVGDSLCGASLGSYVTENACAAGASSGQSGHLPEDAVVIRGGEMRIGDLRLSAETYEARFPGTYGLTFWSWAGLTSDQIARRVGFPHPVLRKSTAGRIGQVIGSDGRPLALVKTFGPGHYTLLLPPPLVDDDLEHLREVFDPPQPNPAAQRQSERDA